jgi:hypothetical protein
MSRVRTWAARLARGHTRLAVRLFLFNALLVFLPVAGLWYLDAYEQHLLEQQERAMVQQARLLAAALAEFPDLSAIGGGLGPQRLLDRLEAKGLIRRERSKDNRFAFFTNAKNRPAELFIAASRRAMTGKIVEQGIEDAIGEDERSRFCAATAESFSIERAYAFSAC